ncbi:hypothetical protein GCM10009107_33240 [Ideonella azotifigens]|uniref:Uncharacterized protein n=1 Tax=Ideonella azotifigens TaxID=513160 RepID=A0ABN1K5S6_9BURK
MLQPAGQVIYLRSQVDDQIAIRLERVAVGLAQHGTATGCQNQSISHREPRDGQLLDVTKCRLTMQLEICRDRAADLLLDLMVTVREPPAQVAPELATNGGLTAARQSNQTDDHNEQAVPEGGAAEVDTATGKVVVKPNGEVVLM